MTWHTVTGRGSLIRTHHDRKKNDPNPPEGHIEVEFRFHQDRQGHPVRLGKRALHNFSTKPGVEDWRPILNRPPTTAYLPLSFEGSVLLEMYKLAWQRRVMFGIHDRVQLRGHGITFGVHVRTSRNRRCVQLGGYEFGVHARTSRNRTLPTAPVRGVRGVGRHTLGGYIDQPRWPQPTYHQATTNRLVDCGYQPRCHN